VSEATVAMPGYTAAARLAGCEEAGREVFMEHIVRKLESTEGPMLQPATNQDGTRRDIIINV
jgi:hypothetical protein